jgi:hypothetical protein
VRPQPGYLKEIAVSHSRIRLPAHKVLALTLLLAFVAGVLSPTAADATTLAIPEARYYTNGTQTVAISGMQVKGAVTYEILNYRATGAHTVLKRVTASTTGPTATTYTAPSGVRVVALSVRAVASTGLRSAPSYPTTMQFGDTHQAKTAFPLTRLNQEALAVATFNFALKNASKCAGNKTFGVALTRIEKEVIRHGYKTGGPVAPALYATAATSMYLRALDNSFFTDACDDIARATRFMAESLNTARLSGTPARPGFVMVHAMEFRYPGFSHCSAGLLYTLEMNRRVDLEKKFVGTSDSRTERCRAVARSFL